MRFSQIPGFNWSNPPLPKVANRSHHAPVRYSNSRTSVKPERGQDNWQLRPGFKGQIDRNDVTSPAKSECTQIYTCICTYMHAPRHSQSKEYETLQSRWLVGSIAGWIDKNKANKTCPQTKVASTSRDQPSLVNNHCGPGVCPIPRGQPPCNSSLRLGVLPSKSRDSRTLSLPVSNE